MIKMIFDIFFKIGILILAICFLLLLKDLIDNLGNGRYQGKTDSEFDLILDTKRGKLYQNRYGQLREVYYADDGYLEELGYDRERYSKELLVNKTAHTLIFVYNGKISCKLSYSLTFGLIAALFYLS